MSEYLQINGYKAEISGRARFLMARGGDGSPLLAVKTQVVEGRVSSKVIREFAQRTGAASVSFVDQFNFLYSPRNLMSYARGTTTRESVYSPEGTLISRGQKTSDY